MSAERVAADLAALSLADAGPPPAWLRARALLPAGLATALDTQPAGAPVGYLWPNMGWDGSAERALRRVDGSLLPSADDFVVVLGAAGDGGDAGITIGRDFEAKDVGFSWPITGMLDAKVSRKAATMHMSQDGTVLVKLVRVPTVTTCRLSLSLSLSRRHSLASPFLPFSRSLAARH